MTQISEPPQKQRHKTLMSIYTWRKYKHLDRKEALPYQGEDYLWEKDKGPNQEGIQRRLELCMII